MSEPTSDEPIGSPKVLLLSGDLLFASKVRVLVDRVGGQMKVAGNLPEGEGDWTHVVLDLGTRSKLATDLVSRCQRCCPRACVMAFGPHVQVDRLKLAREAGIEPVLTNSQFVSNFASMLDS